MGKARAKAPARGRHDLSERVKSIIESRQLSAYAVAKLAGIEPGMVSRFMSGERGLTTGSLDKIGHALVLRIVEVATRRRPIRDVARPDPE